MISTELDVIEALCVMIHEEQPFNIIIANK